LGKEVKRMEVLKTEILDWVTPLFLVAIGAELWLAHRRGLRLHHWADGLTSLSTGVLMQITGLWVNALTVAVFFAVAHYASLPALLNTPTLPDASPVTWQGGIQALGWWVLGFLLVDFAFYCFHRTAHRVNLLWATHVVHHSSEEYNLFVGLRHGSFENLFSALFYLPLAVLGMTFEMFMVCYSLNLIWQFWVHTELVGHLGWMEGIFSTPRHHQVHHAVNPRYIDKNYGGTLIIWDRLLGTYQPLEEPAVYGITTPVRSYSVAWLNIHGFVDIARAWASARNWTERLGYLLLPPGWRPAHAGGIAPFKPVSRATFQRFRPGIPLWLLAYATAQFALVLVAVHFVMQYAYAQPHWGYLSFWIGAVALSVLSTTGLLTANRIALPAELARLTAGLVIGGWLWVSESFYSRERILWVMAYLLLSVIWLLVGRGATGLRAPVRGTQPS
jgi:sterol desaturase/sphingolipid hydroxylase (fatty acid hydroxylase superfamily)